MDESIRQYGYEDIEIGRRLQNHGIEPVGIRNCANTYHLEHGKSDNPCIKHILKRIHSNLHKLPYIQEQLKHHEIFIGSSHLFCKGFLEPWLSYEDLPMPDLICLDRDLRKIGLSLYQLNAIPGRNLAGVKYYLSPRDNSLLTKLEDHESLNNYQLCYWYCLEIEKRKKVYADLIRSKGGTCVHTSIDELKSAEQFAKLCHELNMPGFSIMGKRRYEKIIRRVVNPKTHDKKKLDIPESQLDEWENEVRQRTCDCH